MLSLSSQEALNRLSTSYRKTMPRFVFDIYALTKMNGFEFINADNIDWNNFSFILESKNIYNIKIKNFPFTPPIISLNGNNVENLDRLNNILGANWTPALSLKTVVTMVEIGPDFNYFKLTGKTINICVRKVWNKGIIIEDEWASFTHKILMYNGNIKKLSLASYMFSIDGHSSYWSPIRKKLVEFIGQCVNSVEPVFADIHNEYVTAHVSGNVYKIPTNILADCSNVFSKILETKEINPVIYLSDDPLSVDCFFRCVYQKTSVTVEQIITAFPIAFKYDSKSVMDMYKNLLDYISEKHQLYDLVFAILDENPEKIRWKHEHLIKFGKSCANERGFFTNKLRKKTLADLFHANIR